MAQHIVVTNYNPLWKDMFETGATAIKKILGDNCIAIHHIGSTSVPGLAAKPIIDSSRQSTQGKSVQNRKIEGKKSLI